MRKLYEIASNVCENDMDEIKSAIKRMITLDYIARNEGLFSMETYILDEEIYPEKSFVDLVIGYIVDGRDWEEVEGFLANRILMSDSDKKAYLYFFYKECLKVIKTGKFFCFQKDCICSLVPEKYQLDISAYVDEVNQIEFEKWNEKKKQRILEEYSKIAIDMPETIVEEMKVFEKTANFKTEDALTQTWLRNVDCRVVYVLMLAGSEEFKEVLLSNMSSRMKLAAKEEIVNLAKKWDLSYIHMIREAISNGIDVLNKIQEK